MTIPREEALETLNSLKDAFDAAAKEAQGDGRRWKWLRHYVDPAAVEKEYAGYSADVAGAAALVSSNDTDTAKGKLALLKTRFDLVAVDCRAQPMDILESFFGINTQEAMKFEGWSASLDKVMKLI